MANQTRSQLNVRVSHETLKKLDEIVEFYQENTKLGKVYKGDVLADIIDKSYEVMTKQKLNKRPHLS
ncbi:hypothetical protein [Robertmurraya massiliosenegalensis]|uniref:hypothetical protein n=1 Tax=Robertmurraya massiliosenegalensis TaxID=1287657 RepID=UPI0002F42CF5|nr:hypothetical protein [Robertmurraya massiliosenegalensis]